MPSSRLCDDESTQSMPEYTTAFYQLLTTLLTIIRVHL